MGFVDILLIFISILLVTLVVIQNSKDNAATHSVVKNPISFPTRKSGALNSSCRESPSPQACSSFSSPFGL